ncbi:MAG: hypothetical protein PHV85_07365 [Desulfovibrionaceae bacterium]|nr:hypothetical protein [Desulfovibrionaceae bacterium]
MGYAFRRVLFGIWFHLAVAPVAVVFSLLKRAGRVFGRRPESYFKAVRAGRANARVLGLRGHSLYTALLTLLLAPCALLARGLPRRLFSPLKRPYRASPNEVSALVGSKLRRSILLTDMACRDMGAEYLFCLQPTLLDGEHPLTENDQRFVDPRREKQVMGFSQAAFFAAYYQTLRRDLPRDKRLEACFQDSSRLFYNREPSRFLDTCHLGEPGQRELAEHVARLILEKEGLGKDRG